MPRTWRSSAGCIASTGIRCRVTTSGPTPGREHESAGHALRENQRRLRATAGRTQPSDPSSGRKTVEPDKSGRPRGGPRSVFERLVDRTVLATQSGRIGKGSERFVHRLGWKQLRGPIPDGMELHHRCGVHAGIPTICSSLPTPRIWHTDARRTASAGTRCQVPTYGSTQGLARGAAVSSDQDDDAALPSITDNLHYVNRSLHPGPQGPDACLKRSGCRCPVSRDLVHVSLELDQSTRVSHSIWSARRCGLLRRLIEVGPRHALSHLIWSVPPLVSLDAAIWTYGAVVISSADPR
jgi:hypothetical protein